MSERSRLLWDGARFVWYSADNFKLVYGLKLITYDAVQQITTTRYFLTQVLDRVGNPISTITYQTPVVSGATCTSGGQTGSDPGVPYISTVTGSYGQQLSFSYMALTRSTGETECVISQVALLDPQNGTSSAVASYTYQQDSGSQTRPGLLASAALLEKTVTYSNQQNDGGSEFIVSQGGSVVTHHYYNGMSVSASTALYENISFLPRYTLSGCLLQTQGPDCNGYPEANDVLYRDAGVGDGVNVADFIDHRVSNGTPGLEEKRFYYSTPDAGTSSASWMSGYQDSDDWDIYPITVPPHPFFDVDRRGSYYVNWYTYGGGAQETLDGGGTYSFPQLTELTTVQEGAAGVDLDQRDHFGTPAGISPLQTTNYTYVYGPHSQQLVKSESQTSVLPAAVGDQATEYVNYDANGRVVSRIRKGNAENWLATPVSTTPTAQYIGTFYFINHACLADAPDTLNRTLETHGPCLASGPTATDCLGTGTVPITQYFYYPASYPAAPRNANQLQKVSKFTNNAGLSCTGARHLDTSYASYDAIGNPTSSTDANGVATTMTWTGSLMTSSTTAGQTWNYGYDTGTLSWVQMPQGNYEVSCYRTGTSGAGCTGGNWTDHLQWRAKSSALDGSTWSEKIVYAYWPDGQPKTETYQDASGNARKVVHHGSNALKQPTYSKLGDGNSGTYRSVTQFNAAGDVTAIGFPYNDPPAFCGTPGGAVSPLCTALTNDRLGRVTAVDQYPSGSSPDMHTNITYDAQGNVATVQTGCTSSGACSQPLTTYVYDDFHNVMSVTGPWASNSSGTGSNPISFSYDALGNVTSKQTALMYGTSDYLSTTYDSMGRQLAVVHHYSLPSPGAETLLAFAYDAAASPDSSCPQPANNAGRIFYRADSFGTTWYQYDAFGRVLGEIRLRTGTGSCGSGVSPANVPHTFYTYTNNGNLNTVAYPYGRTVTYAYGTGALADRPSSVTVTTYSGSSWTPQTALTSILWEPYGGLRGYQINHATTSNLSTVEYMLGDDGTTTPTSCGSLSAPSAGTSDHTGLLRGLWVSAGSQSPGTAVGDIYKRTYSWQADQVKQIDTCLLGATTAQTETYGYDYALRLTSAGRPSGNFVATGGAFGSRSYGYDGRGNRIAQVNEDATYNLSLTSTVNPDWLFLQKAAPTCSLLQHAYSYNLDGNVKQKTWATDSSGGPAWQLNFTPGESDSASHGGLDSVYKAVSVNGALYNYWYDAFNRRRLKVYPTGTMDEFFYDGDNQLLVDQGNDSLSSANYYVDDDYVWLGGRPVVVVRGKLSTSWVRQADSSTACNRSGDAQACGFYFPVTDHIGKPVLMLDSSRRVTGTGDYDPFGHVNRVTLDAETNHPATCPSGTWISRLADFKQPVASTTTATTARIRVLFNLVDTFASTSNFAKLIDGDTGAVLVDPNNGNAPVTNIGGPHAGQIWTPWVTPSAGHAQVLYSNAAAGAGNCSTFQGIVMEGYEYLRYQSGAAPYWTPLRFPGQYYDFETDLAQNWNRFYDPATGRYAGPEPLLAMASVQPPSRANQALSSSAHAPSWPYLRTLLYPVFAYALDNPVINLDPDGRGPGDTDPVCGLTERECQLHAEHLHDDWCRCEASHGTTSLIYDSNWQFPARILGMSCKICGVTDYKSEPTSLKYFSGQSGFACNGSSD